MNSLESEIKKRQEEVSKIDVIKLRKINFLLSNLYAMCKEVLPEWSDNIKYKDVDFIKCKKSILDKISFLKEKESSLEKTPENQIEICLTKQAILSAEAETDNLLKIEKELKEVI